MVTELPADPPLHLGTVTGVFDRIVQQAADRGILTAAVLQHQRRDRHHVGQVGDTRPLAQLRGVYLAGHSDRPLKPGGQQGRCRGGPCHDGHGTRQQHLQC
jgi:hypothetical protein